MASLQAASVSYKIAFGPHQGQRVRTLKTLPPFEHDGEICVNHNGFSLHAGVSVSSRGGKKLERLCRYIARPALSHERLSVNDSGEAVYELKTPYRDGSTHIVLSPLELMQKLAALVPRPWINLTRYHGVLAPNAKWRSRIVPASRTDNEGAEKRGGHIGVPGEEKEKEYRHPWADLLRHVFNIEMTICPYCGGRVKMIAVITQPDAIEKILNHIYSKHHPPP